MNGRQIDLRAVEARPELVALALPGPGLQPETRFLDKLL
jgi:hypothetical protein